MSFPVAAVLSSPILLLCVGQVPLSATRDDSQAFTPWLHPFHQQRTLFTWSPSNTSGLSDFFFCHQLHYDLKEHMQLG